MWKSTFQNVKKANAWRAPFHPRPGRSLVRKNLWRSGETIHDASGAAIRPRVVMRTSRGLITDGVETVPTVVG